MTYDNNSVTHNKITIPRNMEALTSFNKLVFSSKKDRNRSSEKIKCNKIIMFFLIYTLLKSSQFLTLMYVYTQRHSEENYNI